MGAAIGGIIGALIAESASDADDLIAQLVKTKKVDLEAIVHEEINRHFVESNPVGTVVDADGDAEFQFTVTGYGMTQAHFTIAKVEPSVSIQGKLVRRDGTVIWEKTAAQDIMNDTPKDTSENWMRDIDATREGYRKDIKAVVAKLVRDLPSSIKFGNLTLQGREAKASTPE